MLKTRIAAAAASSALVLSLLAPAAFASTSVTISGNGKNSTNDATVTNKSKTVVSQTNNSIVGVNVNSSASTGGNKANGNTGGDTSIHTGKAVSTVGVAVIGGVNVAGASDCGCGDPETTVEVKNNGKNSNNTVDVKNKDKKVTKQENNSFVGAHIDSFAKTGWNKANDNTGGDVDVKTDDATSEVGVLVATGGNVLVP